MSLQISLSRVSSAKNGCSGLPHQRFVQGGYVHEFADLCNDIELIAFHAAATVVFLLWVYRYLKREFKRDD